MRITMKAARINANLTQEEMADRLGVTKKTIGSWENGKTKPKLDKVEPICSLLGVGYDDIMWNV